MTIKILCDACRAVNVCKFAEGMRMEAVELRKSNYDHIPNCEEIKLNCTQYCADRGKGVKDLTAADQLANSFKRTSGDTAADQFADSWRCR